MMGIVENIAFTLVGALIGYIVSNRLAIGRDKRKEFNDLINPIRRELLGITNNPRSNLTGAWMITFSLIREKLPRWKRRSFDRAIENYRESKSYKNRESDGMGGFLDGDNSAIVHAANDILKYLKPR
jgi:hypothetical protein